MTGSTESARIGVALVGPGMISEYHLNGLAATNRADLKAIVGRRVESASALAKRFPAGLVSDDLDAVLAHAEVDAVVVTTPDDTHETIATAALRAGKSVLLQKPMSTDCASCRAKSSLLFATLANRSRFSARKFQAA